MDTLKHIFSSVLGISANDISDELSPENTPSWDSLNSIILITEIEKSFAIRFQYDEVMAVKNFGQAVELIRSKGGKI